MSTDDLTVDDDLNMILVAVIVIVIVIAAAAVAHIADMLHNYTIVRQHHSLRAQGINRLVLLLQETSNAIHKWKSVYLLKCASQVSTYMLRVYHCPLTVFLFCIRFALLSPQWMSESSDFPTSFFFTCCTVRSAHAAQIRYWYVFLWHAFYLSFFFFRFREGVFVCREYHVTSHNTLQTKQAHTHTHTRLIHSV